MIGQAIADGFLTGAIIALGAIGVSLSMQILRFANFSQKWEWNRLTSGLVKRHQGRFVQHGWGKWGDIFTND